MNMINYRTQPTTSQVQVDSLEDVICQQFFLGHTYFWLIWAYINIFHKGHRLAVLFG